MSWAAAAVMFYPLQFYLIPKLQRRVNMMAKRRVQLVRQLSDRIGETVAGAQDIHVHNTAGLELAQFSRRLGGIFDVRLKIYVWKFIIKFINNTINQLGPFFFYSIGGYMVIIGRFELDTLVAVLAAVDVADCFWPWCSPTRGSNTSSTSTAACSANACCEGCATTSIRGFCVSPSPPSASCPRARSSR